MMIAMMHDGRSVRLLCAMIQGKIGDRKGVYAARAPGTDERRERSRKLYNSSMSQLDR